MQYTSDMNRPHIIILAHNIRSTYNVGSIFRTADGFGVEKIILSGYTPYPKLPNDPRLPHLRTKITKDIHKTALGAELTVPFEYNSEPPLDSLKDDGYIVAALEQHMASTSLAEFKTPERIALLIGEEVHGIESQLLEMCDIVLEIPMYGEKESFNVSAATAIALYQLAIIGV